MSSNDIEVTGKRILLGLFGIVSVIAVIVLLIGAFTFIYTVGAGNVAVKFDSLGGGVQDGETGEGMHFKMPWVSIDQYNVKTQEYTMVSTTGEGEVSGDDSMKCITSEGLELKMDVTVLYHIIPNEASDIRSEIGKDGDYQSIVVRPNVRAKIREVVASYEAADIYGEKRDLVEEEIFNQISDVLLPYHIIVEDVLLRSVKLPDKLTESIDQKKQAEQDAQRMVYILEQEQKEKERKIIEAEGIRESNMIIRESLSDEYLQWYWIDGLGNHDSVVYLLDSESGLPVFKDIDNPDG